MARLLPLLLLSIAAPVFAQDAPPPAASSISSGKNETRADVEARAVATFQRLDLNQDGFVTADEMKAAAAKRMGIPADKITVMPPMLQAMIDDADTNHDGKISLEEAKAAALRGFDEADTNHDGVVTPEERMAARTKVTNAVEPKSTVGR